MKYRANSIPFNALKGGSTENETLYIGRAMEKTQLAIGEKILKVEVKKTFPRNYFPGSVLPSQNALFIEHGHFTIQKTEFEILVGGSSAYWVKSSNGKFPTNAFVGGYTVSRNTLLYVGRQNHNNRLLVGKLEPGQQCLIPDIGATAGLKFSEYEVLVI